MTLAEFKSHVWRRLPLRKHLVGRVAVDDMVELAIHNWESEPLHYCTTDAQRQVVAANILQSVRRGYQAISGREPEEYGMFWAIVLQALASLVVQFVLKWWLESRMNRIRLVVWQKEMHR